MCQPKDPSISIKPTRNKIVKQKGVGSGAHSPLEVQPPPQQQEEVPLPDQEVPLANSQRRELKKRAKVPEGALAPLRRPKTAAGMETLSIAEIITTNTWLEDYDLTKKRLAIPEDLHKLQANVAEVSEYYPDALVKFNKLLMVKGDGSPDKDDIQQLTLEVAERKAALTNMSPEDKSVREKLAELKRQNKDVSNWLLQYPVRKGEDGKKMEHGPWDVLTSYEELPGKLQEYLKEDVPLKMAEDLLKAAFQDISDPVAKLLPEGFKSPSPKPAVINSAFPDESRPKLLLDEAVAVMNYCLNSYNYLNPACRDEAFKDFEIQFPPNHDANEMLMKQALLNRAKGEVQIKLKKHLEVTLPKAEAAWIWEQEENAGAVNKLLVQCGRDQVTQRQLDTMTPEQLVEHIIDREGLPPEAPRTKEILEEVKKAHEHTLRLRRDLENARRDAEKFKEESEGGDALEKSAEWWAIAKCPEEFALLLEAFAKAKPLSQPVQVKRGLKFASTTDAEKYLAPFRQSMADGSLVPLVGFQSTTTLSIPPVGRATSEMPYFVKLKITAKKGLDVMPYAYYQMERELLLEHATKVLARNISEKPDKKTYTVLLEQILPKIRDDSGR